MDLSLANVNLRQTKLLCLIALNNDKGSGGRPFRRFWISPHSDQNE